MKPKKENPAPTGIGKRANSNSHPGNSRTVFDDQVALREMVLKELRCTRTRLALAITGIDSIGVSLRYRLIGARTAIVQSQPILTKFDDRSFEREFCARVEREAALEEKRRKRCPARGSAA